MVLSTAYELCIHVFIVAEGSKKWFKLIGMRKEVVKQSNNEDDASKRVESGAFFGFRAGEGMSKEKESKAKKEISSFFFSR